MIGGGGSGERTDDEMKAQSSERSDKLKNRKTEKQKVARKLTRWPGGCCMRRLLPPEMLCRTTAGLQPAARLQTNCAAQKRWATALGKLPLAQSQGYFLIKSQNSLKSILPSCGGTGEAGSADASASAVGSEAASA